jgi:energy-coupling factor transporter ATP-binding protein EcfA2
MMRERRFNLVVGAPGSGKSTFVAEIVKKYNNGNVCVWKHKANYDDPAFKFLPIKTESNWRQGVSPGNAAKFMMVGNKDGYKSMLKWLVDENNSTRFRNGLLVVDDATIFEKYVLSEEMQELVAMRRHHGYFLDIWLVYHGMTQLPIEQFTFVNNVIIFNTADNMKYKSSKIPADKLNAAVLRAQSNFQQGQGLLKRDEKKARILMHTPQVVKLS